MRRVVLVGDDQPPVVGQGAEDARAEVAAAEELAGEGVELGEALHDLGREQLGADLPDGRQVAPEAQAGDRARRLDQGRGPLPLGGQEALQGLGVAAGRRRQGQLGARGGPSVQVRRRRRPRGPCGAPRATEPNSRVASGSTLARAPRTSSGRAPGAGRAGRSPRPAPRRRPRPRRAFQSASSAIEAPAFAPSRTRSTTALSVSERVGDHQRAVDDRVGRLAPRP